LQVEDNLNIAIVKNINQMLNVESRLAAAVLFNRLVG